MKILGIDGTPVTAKVFNKFFALKVGEEGRGRRVGFLPLHKDYQFDEVECSELNNVDVIKTKKGNWLIVPGNEKSKTAGLVMPPIGMVATGAI